MKNFPTANQPLAGIEVIELSNMITCSLAAMTMAAQGAKIIKIEPPLGGDQMRPLAEELPSENPLVEQLQSRHRYS